MGTRWFGLILAFLAVVVSVVLLPVLPPEVPTHWSLMGEPDDWSSRTTAVLFGPGTIFAIWVLAWILPLIDPKRMSYAKFSGAYWTLINTLLLFVLVTHVALLANGAGAPVNVARVIGASVGVLLVIAGIYLRRVEPNWFIGIRTPWTLSSESVWRRTHVVGGRLFVGAGALTFIIAFLPGTHAFYAAVIATAIAAFLSAALSLVFWLQEKRREEA